MGVVGPHVRLVGFLRRLVQVVVLLDQLLQLNKKKERQLVICSSRVSLTDSRGQSWLTCVWMSEILLQENSNSLSGTWTEGEAESEHHSTSVTESTGLDPIKTALPPTRGETLDSRTEQAVHPGLLSWYVRCFDFSLSVFILKSVAKTGNLLWLQTSIFTFLLLLYLCHRFRLLTRSPWPVSGSAGSRAPLAAGSGGRGLGR